MSVVLAGVGIVATMGGLSAIAHAESDAEDRETMQQLAVMEWDEQNAAATLDTASSGDFSEFHVTGYTWATTVDSTSTTNLDHITLVVSKTDDSFTSIQLDSVVYSPPTTTATGTATP